MHENLCFFAATPFFLNYRQLRGFGDFPGDASEQHHMQRFLSFQSFELKWILYEHLRCEGQE